MGLFNACAIKRSIGHIGRKHRSQGTTLVALCRDLEHQTSNDPARRQDAESVIAKVQEALEVASASAPRKGVNPFEQAQKDLVEFTEHHQISLGNINEKMEDAHKKDKEGEKLKELAKTVFRTKPRITLDIYIGSSELGHASPLSGDLLDVKFDADLLLEGVLWILTRARPKDVSYDKNPHFYENLESGAQRALDKRATIDPCPFTKKLSDFSRDRRPVFHILLDCKWRIFADSLIPNRMFRGFWTLQQITIFLKDCNGVLHAVYAFGSDIKPDLRLSDMESDAHLQDGTWVDLITYAIKLEGQPRDLRIQTVPESPHVISQPPSMHETNALSEDTTVPSHIQSLDSASNLTLVEDSATNSTDSHLDLMTVVENEVNQLPPREVAEPQISKPLNSIDVLELPGSFPVDPSIVDTPPQPAVSHIESAAKPTHIPDTVSNQPPKLELTDDQQQQSRSWWGYLFGWSS